MSECEFLAILFYHIKQANASYFTAFSRFFLGILYIFKRIRKERRLSRRSPCDLLLIEAHRFVGVFEILVLMRELRKHLV